MENDVMIPETDQWKMENPDCDFCRRQSYCSKECGPKKRARKAAIREEAKKKMAEMFGVSPEEIVYLPNGKVVINRKEPEATDVETNEVAPDTSQTDSNE